MWTVVLVCYKILTWRIAFDKRENEYLAENELVIIKQNDQLTT